MGICFTTFATTVNGEQLAASKYPISGMLKKKKQKTDPNLTTSSNHR